MKKLALTLIACGTAIGVFAQGSIQFQNFVGGQLRSPVYDVDPASPLEQKTGNTAAGIPAGTQTYGGALLQGTNYTAELWGGPLGSTEAALQFVDTTVFRTNLAAGLVVAKTVIVQGVLPGQRGTFQVRAWDNKGRTITNWPSALAAWNAGEIALGKSELFSPVEPLGGGIILPPIGLFGLTSFNLRMVPPTIVTQPQSQIVECGGDVSFAVVATSPHPLTYRWYFNQTNLLSEGPSSITVSNADFNDAGSYHAVVVTSLGSVASDNAVLTVVDTTRPTLAVCPPARVLPADTACTATLSDLTDEIVAADTCSPVTVSQVPPAGTLLIAGIHPILLTVTDSSGNATNCTTLVTVADAISPAIVVCATNQTVSATSGCQGLLPDLRSQVVATDNCGVVTTSQAPPPGTILAPGATVVTLTVADAAGNTANCDAVITVIDDTPPAIVVCPSDHTLSANTNCQAILPDLTGELTAVDNCASVTVTQAPPPGTVLPLGATTVTFTVSDTSGNSTNCAAQVTVRDTTPPTIVTCAADRVLSADVICSAAVPDLTGEVVATDDCGGITVTQVPAAGSTLGIGSTPVLLTVSDMAGNTTNCTAVLTVNDSTPPVIVVCPPNRALSAGADCQAIVPDIREEVVATDNCGVSTVTQVPAAGTAVALGVTAITLTVSDAAGNSTNCVSTLTVNDTTAPSIISCATNRTFLVDANCQANLPDLTGEVVAADNCGAFTVTQNPPAGASLSLGLTAVMLTVSDTAGNSSNCLALITVIDTTPPMILACAPNRALAADANCRAALPDLTPEVTASDNCGMVTITQAPAPGTLIAGTTEVVMTVSDAAGNVAQCATLVTINDTTPPVISVCATNRTLPADTNCQATVPDLAAEVIASDNCGNVIVTQMPPPGTIVPLGATAVVLTATDGSGNTASCTATITVSDQTPPTIASCAADRTISADDQCQAALPDLTGEVSATDNCTAVTVTQVPPAGTLVPLGSTVVTLAVSDVAGNSTNCTATVIVRDTSPPVILSCAESQTLPADTSCRANIPDLTQGLVASDNCGPVTISQVPTAGAAIPPGPATVTMTVTDAAGNSNTCDVSITVVDATPPVITACAPNRTVTTDANCQANVPDMRAEIVASDNCTSVSITQAPPPGTLVGIGPTEVIFLVADQAGNTTNCVATLNVVDIAPPTVVCPENILVTIPALERQIAVEYDAPVAADNCSVASVVCVPPSGAPFLVGTNSVQCTATDSAGNTSSCAFLVVVVQSPPDAVPPTVQVFPAQTNVPLGTSVVFCAEIVSETPVLIQWRRNAVNLPDETNTCLRIDNVQLEHGGAYSVVVANNAGSAVSGDALLILDLPPVDGSDGASTPVPVDGTEGLLGGTNTLAGSEPDEPRHAGKPGGKSVWYEWTAPDTGIAVFQTEGSTFDTLLAVYVDCSGELKEIASDDDSGGNLASRVQFNAIDGTQYRIAVDGYAGADGQFALSWEFEPAALLSPVILTQPSSQTVAPGQSVLFSVVAVSGCPECDPCLPLAAIPAVLQYQWYRDGNPIEGATEPSFAIASAQETDLGAYTVAISQSGQSILSREARLQFNLTGQEVQQVQTHTKLQDAIESQPIELGATLPGLAQRSDKTVPASPATVVRGYTGTQIFSTTGSGPGPLLCNVIGGASQWITFVPNQTGVLHLNTDGSSYNTVLAVFIQTGDPEVPLRMLVCDNNSGEDGRDSALSLGVEAGETNLVLIDGVRGETGTLHLNYSLVITADVAPIRLTPDGLVTLRFTGRPELRLTVEVSTDAVTWTPAATLTSLSDTIEWVDPTPPSGQRFYRALMLP